MADCINYVDYTNAIFSKNVNLLYGPIAQSLLTQTPWASVYKSGTFPAQVASTLLAVAQGRTKMGSSLAAPSFTSMLNLCGSAGISVDKSGTNQWSYLVEIGNGRSDKICLNNAFIAFKESVMSMLSAYQEGVTQLIAADLRWQTYLRSGVKAVVRTGVGINSMITGGENNIDQPTPAVLSNAPLDVTTLNAFVRFMKTNLRAKMFGGTGAGAHAKLLASAETLEDLRNDLGGGIHGTAFIRPLTALAQGGGTAGTTGMTSYLFEQLFRGVEYGEDTIDLRLNWNGAGYDPVDPDVATAATAGTVAETSIDWLNASHTVSFLVFDDAFARLTPENWTGEGKVRFDQQMYGGQIKFMNHPDMDCNLFGDWGVLAYRIGRALKPLHPWFVLPIISKRCVVPNTLSTCTGVSG